MITIHEKTAQTFGTLGLGALLPASCVITEELNGAFELEMEHPYDESGKWRRIERGRILYAPTPTGMQPFRIYNTAQSMTSIKVNARHIFYDLLDNFIRSVRGIYTAPEALGAMVDAFQYPMPFTFSTDITIDGWFEISKTNPISGLLSDDDEMYSFIRRYGGELLRDHFHAAMNSRIGTDTDVTIRYGKNLVGLEVNEDESGIFTRIEAYGEDARHNDFWVTLDSTHINDYIYPKNYYFTDTSVQTPSELRNKASALFIEDKIDLPKINIKVDFLPLAKTEEYRDFAALEEVQLGDTVTVINTRMGFSKRAKVISYRWDCILGQYDQIELGDFMDTIASSITDGERSYNMAERAISEASGTAAKLSGRISVTEQNLYVGIDSDVYSSANKLFRFGKEGLQFTSNGINAAASQWKTLITPDGEFVIEN